MTTEQKKQAILQAIADKKASGIEIDRVRRGSTVGALKAGKPLEDKTIDKLYANLEQVLAQKTGTMEQTVAQKEQAVAQSQAQVVQKAVPVAQKEQGVAQNLSPEMAGLLARIAALARENAELREQVQHQERQLHARAFDLTSRINGLEGRLVAIEQKPVAIEQPTIAGTMAKAPDRVLGFRLVQKVTTTDGKKYEKWYATKGAKVVYIGNSPEKADAEAKIRAYAAKHGMRLDDSPLCQQNQA